jgi:hypothetical protein
MTNTAKNFYLAMMAAAALAIVSIGWTATTAQAAAGSTDGKVMRVEIPFEFYLRNEKMAAGEYEIEKVSERAYSLKNKQTGQKAVIAASFLLANKKGLPAEKLVFNRYGSENFLREIYANRAAEGLGWAETKTERRIRQRLENDTNLADKTKRETVSVTITTK